MKLIQPESMEECLYFTRRTIGENGSLFAWVYKQDCPECGKAKMGKPVDPKTGKAKIRAKEYVCSNCGNVVSKEENESKLFANIKYTCPHCKNKGELQIPFVRKKTQGVETLRFQCQKCNQNIDVTKKMKKKKEK